MAPDGRDGAGTSWASMGWASMGWHLALISGVASLVMFLQLGAPRLWDRDEPRNAACAREMLERGDWVVPTFNGELRVLKPAMKYWLMMIAYQLFGVNEFAARFWSAVFAVATALATYAIGRRLFGPRVGLWSALILTTSLLFATAGHLAKIDAALTFFATLTILIYVRSAFTTPQPSGDDTPNGATEAMLTTPFPHSWLVAALIYAAVGLGALAKGMPGLVVPPAVIGMFLLIARLPERTGGAPRGWTRWLAVFRPFAPGHFARIFWMMRPLTAALVVLAVAGPWYALVGLRTDGEFLRGFFLEHNFGRALQPLEGHSGPFLLYYLGAIVAGFLPWSMLLPALLIALVVRMRQGFARGEPIQAARLLLLCWVSVYVVIFSCARTKLPSYITPCFPGLALLMGVYVDELAAGRHNVRWARLGLVGLAGLGAVVAVGFVVAARIYWPGAELLGTIGVLLAAGAVVALRLLHRERSLAAAVALTVTAIVFATSVFGVGLPRLGGQKEQQEVYAVMRRHSDTPRLGAFGAIDPSWVFYAKHPIQPVALRPPEAPDDPWKVEPIAAATFFGADKDRFILTTESVWPKLRPALGADAQIVAESPRFLRPGRWLLIGHAERH